MSLAIDVEQITHVLLADGWHEVTGQSFTLDSYEYLADNGEFVLHGGGQYGVCANGFAFRSGETDNFGDLFGPLTSILAVRCISRPD